MACCAEASEAGCSAAAVVCTAAGSGSSFSGFFKSVCVTTRSGSSVSTHLRLGKVGFLFDGLLIGTGLRRLHRFQIRAWRMLRDLGRRRRQVEADFRPPRAEISPLVIRLQMHDRQRDPAGMQRERNDCGKNPQPA